MAYGTINVDAMTTSDGVTSAGTYGFKNRIINGAMVINQRATSITSTGYSVDRFAYFGSQASKVTVSQDTSVYSTGFNASLKVLSSSAYTVGSTEEFEIYQSIEGYNIADLGWGTANAKTVTLSFQVYSSLTGTFGGALQNGTGARSYPFNYTISSANTWTTVSVTIAGDTSGTWGTTNGIGIAVYFGLGVGSTKSGTAGSWSSNYYTSVTGATSVVGTSGATFYITGVQLEKGSTATSFDYRPYGTELALCQRYALKYNTDTILYAYIGMAYAFNSTTIASVSLPLPVQMRAAPSVTSSTLMLQDGATVTAVTSIAVVSNQTSSTNAYLQATVASGLTNFRPYQLQTNNSTSGYLLLSSEL
jgi:hypothetical protein